MIPSRRFRSWERRFGQVRVRAALVIMAVVPAMMALHAAWCLLAPAGTGTLTIVEVVHGTSISRIAAQLHAAGVIRSSLYFHVLARLAGKPLQAGEYAFRRTRLFTVLRKVQEGRVYLHRFLVPEGDSLWQIREALKREGLADPGEFMRAVRDTGLLSRLGVSASIAEGYLFPDTYYLPKGMEARQIVTVMVQRFFEKVPAELIARGKDWKFDLHRLVTFASIVEKEAGVHDERPLIAAVFHNRLRKRMLLQADPTVLYALRRWDWRLSWKDLRVDHPYNTYRFRGLPPGPICSPGLACLQAAVSPAKVNYLFFVTRKDGTSRHEFSSTLKAHQGAIRRSKSRVVDQRHRSQ